MSAVITNTFGVVSTLLNNGGGQIANTNTALQVLATGTALIKLNAGTAPGVIVINSAAFGSAIVQLQTDMVAHNTPQVIGDSLSALGDFLGVLEGIAVYAAPKYVGPLQYLAGLITQAGIGVNVTNSVSAGAPGIISICGQATSLLSALSSDLESGFSAVSTILGEDFTATESAFSTALNSFGTALVDLGTSQFNTDMAQFATDLSNAESPINSLYSDSGITVTSITQAINSDNSFSVSNGGSIVVATGNVNVDGSGNVIGVTVANSSNLNISQNTIVHSDGSVTSETQAVNSASVVQYTETDTFNTAGAISAAISGDDDTSYLYDSKINVSTGGDVYIDGTGDTITDSSGAGITFILGAGNNSSNTIKGSSPLFLRNDTVAFADTGVNGYTISVSGNVLTYGDPSTVTLSGAYGSMAHLEFADGSVINQLSTVQNWMSHIVNDANATQADTVVFGSGSGEILESSTGGTASTQCTLPANDNAVLVFDLEDHHLFAA